MAAVMKRGSIRQARYKDRNGQWVFLENRWEVRFPLNGRNVSKYVRGTEADANRKLTEWLGEVDDGSAVQPNTITVERWLDEHIKASRTTKSTDWLVKARQYARHWSRRIGAIKLQKLTALDVARARDANLETLSPKTVKDGLVWLKASLNAAIKAGMVRRNAAEHVDPPRQEQAEIRPLTAEEAERYLAVCWAHDRSEMNMLAVGLLRGVRTFRELGGVRLADWHPKTRIVTLGQVLRHSETGASKLGKPGGNKGKGRPLRMPAEAVPYLERQAEWVRQKLAGNLGWNPHRLLFCTVTGDLMPHTSLQRAHKGILAEAGLPLTTRIHDLRHTTATLLFERNVHPKLVQEVLGHSSIKMTLDLYSHVLPQMVSDALDGLWTQPAKSDEMENG